MAGLMLQGNDRSCPRAPARLTKRADFVKAAKGARAHARSFALQARLRAEQPDDAASGPRVGFTVTRKTGGSVERNRIRRRLREAVRLSPELSLRPDHDYVLVARREALSQKFDALRQDLERAVRKLHQPKAAAANRGPRPQP
jgi:ribonuclease P protein component